MSFILLWMTNSKKKVQLVIVPKGRVETYKASFEILITPKLGSRPPNGWLNPWLKAPESCASPRKRMKIQTPN